MAKPSSDQELKLLILGNLVPLITVLFFGADLWYLLLLYWLENFIAGGFNILMILTSKGQGLLTRLLFAMFFSAHYGGFTAAHLFFLLVFLGGETDLLQYMFDNGLMLGLNAVLLSLSYLKEFMSYWLPWRGVGPEMLMSAPYGRIILLQVTIILGAFVTVLVGGNVGFLVVLVLLKTSVDVWFHIRYRQESRNV